MRFAGIDIGSRAIKLVVVDGAGNILLKRIALVIIYAIFAKGADISLYWGSPEDFVSELTNRWSESNQ